MVRIILIIYLVVMTGVGMVAMAVDKAKAMAKKWRTKESTLFLISLIGGSLGTWLGMYVFRHKTRHWYFVFGMPLIFFVHAAVLFVLFKNGIV